MFSSSCLHFGPERAETKQKAAKRKAHFLIENENWLINNVIIIVPVTTVPQFMYSMCCSAKKQDSRGDGEGKKRILERFPCR